MAKNSPGVVFNFKELEATINKEVARISYPTARKLAKTTFERAKVKLVNEIREHLISKELSDPESHMDSQFIVGGEYEKNLYGFFGFEAGRNPVEELVDEIDGGFDINLNAPLVNNRYVFDFEYLTMKELEAATPLDWTSRSWLKAVENGIANINRYITKYDKGRSLLGIQIKNKLKNPGEYKTTPYLTPMMKRFQESLRNAKGVAAIGESAGGQRFYNIRDTQGRFA